MPGLLSLPLELLENVFYRLDSIDDVHHFARVSKRTYDVIRLSSAYTNIMRCIIGFAPQHRFDIVLCGLLQVHRDIVAHFAEHGSNSPLLLATQPNLQHGSFEAQLFTIVSDECSSGPCKKCLPDNRVYEILARYQGLRVLEDEWLARPLGTHDLLAVEQTVDRDPFVQAHKLLLKQHEDFKDNVDPRTDRDSFAATHYISFNPDQRHRFHAALISVWVLNEVRWIFAQFTSQRGQPVSSIQLKLLDLYKDMVERHKIETPVVDEADRYAMWQFLYQHILPLYGSFLADQDCFQLPLTYPSVFAESPHRTRMFQLFLLAGQTYLQPPDLIDLVLRYRTSRKKPYPELKIPSSTRFYRRPVERNLFGSGTYDESRVRSLENHAILELNTIVRATINQSEEKPFISWVTPSGSDWLFCAIDESATYFSRAIMTRFEADMKKDFHTVKRLETIIESQREEWNKVWWEVWWWANSEDKARVKIERWASMD
ncbi:hypothetical protein BU23DRAFT_554710 [Bimuria novae-zelandiae CBS 107.79]|uniref:F-box domain-containing protein n=1 Tax=Bimuria novae-zelandiae CBS 107.79 TaxID=1447943 RepID=A0A6A5VCW8_9PLEO|nr:hypothetical protein BU23DRAFT_554710 [Bimuria novae-zelandiae CBS 107.79]